MLHENGYTHPMGSPGWLRQPAFIQSFEVPSLPALRGATPFEQPATHCTHRAEALSCLLPFAVLQPCTELQ